MAAHDERRTSARPERMARASAEPPARRPKPKPRFGILRKLFAGLFALALLCALGLGAYGWHTYQRYAADLPTLDGLRHYEPRVMSRVYAGNDQLIAELATERRIFMPVGAIPDMVKQAFISAEDQNFYSHHGIDPLAIARAGWTDLMQYGQGRRPIGASTITQQVAKNMLLSNEVSIARKIKEVILATRIDDSLSKDQILELYLNEIYLGMGAYGIAAAAQAYFDKPLDELTLPEAAFLAALPKAPNNYNPSRYPEAAKGRRDWVLDRMADDHAITAEQAKQAKAAPIVPATFHRPETLANADWFAEEVRRQMVAQFGAEATTQGGYAIRTSLDPALQTAAENALHDGLLAYDRAHGGWRGPVVKLDADAGFAKEWPSRLAAVPRTPGMLDPWRLATALDVNAAEAKLGWLEAKPGQADGTGVAETGTLSLADVRWARPVRGGGFGPAPRRMGDVIQPGDVVMVETTPAAPAKGKAPAKPARILLRQIPKVQGALVSLDPMTGRVLAMVGGWSFDNSQFNRATQAQRQPGSSFKPMVYLSALEAGYSPSQRVLDAPFVQNLGSGGQWRPNNYNLSFRGPVPLRIALEQSLNLVTIRLAEAVGMDAVAQNALAFHVVDGMPKVLPAALGAVETTVLRQASAYAGLAMGGKEVLPSLVDSVQDRHGTVIWRASGIECKGCDDPSKPPTLTDARRQIADPDSTFQLVTMMQGVVSRGTGVSAGRGLNHPIAGKTGTTQDFNDAWFVGFTRDLVTAVWVGNDDNTSLGDKETGGSVAAPIFHDYMEAALKNRPVLQFPMPEGMTMATWNSGYGERADAFKPDQAPGASNGTISGGELAPLPDGMTVSDTAPSAGIDSGLGGLY